MSIQESIKIIPHQVPEGSIAVVEIDLIGEKVNVLSFALMTRLQEVIEELKKSSFKCVIFKSNKNKNFFAGADINEIKTMNSKAQFEPAVEKGQKIFNQLEDLPFPTIAAIHGVCAGGGCEFILACDYRIASEDASTKIGLPETKLGLIPGFGGCSRLPRVIGLASALDIILNGKLVPAKKAYKLGLVDALAHPNLLMEQTLKMASELIRDGSKKKKKTFKPKGLPSKILETTFLGQRIIYNQARKNVLKFTHGHYPAPLKAIEVIRKVHSSCQQNSSSHRDYQMKVEREAFCELAVTSVSKNLIHVFFLTEMVKKQTGVSSEKHLDLKFKPIKRIGILGAGTMGGGIAYAAADRGLEARMKDLNHEAIGNGLKHAYDLWKKEVKKKKINTYEMKQRMDRISGTTEFSGFKVLDLVIEAIVEDMDIKKKVIAETASQLSDEAIISTNTSSLSVSEMAKGHPRPQFFAGMHFFNPVNKMPLVEIIRGEKTSDETIASIFDLSKKMGKTPVVVKDGPGFLVNRLLLPYMTEAIFLLQEGMSIDRVDKAFVSEFGMPMGPFALMDEVGLDVCFKVVKIFKKSFGERIEVPSVFEKLAKTTRLGKKNLKGFYTYDEKGNRLLFDPSIYNELSLKEPTNPHSTKTCIERGVFSMINECALALYEDRIVASPDEVDLAMIMGTGFPPFRGGLLKYADTMGLTYLVDQLELYAAQGAPRLKPSTPLKNKAKNDLKFYK